MNGNKQHRALEALKAHLQLFTNVTIELDKEGRVERITEKLTISPNSSINIVTILGGFDDIAHEVGFLHLMTDIEDDEIRRCIIKFALAKNGQYDEFLSYHLREDVLHAFRRTQAQSESVIDIYYQTRAATRLLVQNIPAFINDVLSFCHQSLEDDHVS